MRFLDRILRNWRYIKVKPHIPQGCRVADIGGYDGSFFRKIRHKLDSGVCLDPLIDSMTLGNVEYQKHQFIDKLPLPDDSFDIVTLIAVYEHLGRAQEAVARESFRILRKGGCAILTVPGGRVDAILGLLRKLRLLDGMSVEQHDNFESAHTPDFFIKSGFKLKKWTKFQFGLNNLFIFEK